MFSSYACSFMHATFHVQNTHTLSSHFSSTFIEITYFVYLPIHRIFSFSHFCVKFSASLMKSSHRELCCDSRSAKRQGSVVMENEVNGESTVADVDDDAASGGLLPPVLVSQETRDEVKAELEALKLELKQTMEMYRSACREELAARQKAVELQKWKNEEEKKLEESVLAEKAAMAECIAAREAAKAGIAEWLWLSRM